MKPVNQPARRTQVIPICDIGHPPTLTMETWLSLARRQAGLRDERHCDAFSHVEQKRDTMLRSLLLYCIPNRVFAHGSEKLLARPEQAMNNSPLRHRKHTVIKWGFNDRGVDQTRLIHELTVIGKTDVVIARWTLSQRRSVFHPNQDCANKIKVPREKRSFGVHSTSDATAARWLPQGPATAKRGHA